MLRSIPPKYNLQTPNLIGTVLIGLESLLIMAIAVLVPILRK